MRISIIGGGYVGLVSAVCLAELGNSIDIIELDNSSAISN
jgi:UDPglucose 6-dehydrogenase